jgi:hypothetical protein
MDSTKLALDMKPKPANQQIFDLAVQSGGLLISSGRSSKDHAPASFPTSEIGNTFSCFFLSASVKSVHKWILK